MLQKYQWRFDGLIVSKRKLKGDSKEKKTKLQLLLYIDSLFCNDKSNKMYSNLIRRKLIKSHFLIAKIS